MKRRWTFSTLDSGLRDETVAYDEANKEEIVSFSTLDSGLRDETLVRLHRAG